MRACRGRSNARTMPTFPISPAGLRTQDFGSPRPTRRTWTTPLGSARPQPASSSMAGGPTTVDLPSPTCTPRPHTSAPTGAVAEQQGRYRPPPLPHSFAGTPNTEEWPGRSQSPTRAPSCAQTRPPRLTLRTRSSRPAPPTRLFGRSLTQGDGRCQPPRLRPSSSQRTPQALAEACGYLSPAFASDG